VPHTLLLADHSVTIQRLVALTFANEDVEVVAVSDGNEAIAALDQTTPPDIVLADVGMPGTDGYGVARHVRGTPRLAHIPVLLMNSAFEPIDQQVVEEVGCQGVLAKPFEPQVVVERVRELLGRRSRPALVVSSEPPAAPRPMMPDAVEQYFEQLDEAFARLTAQRQENPPAPPEAPESSQSVEAPVLSSAAPPVPPASGPAGPFAWPLADAFAALLAAERAGASASPLCPAAPASGRAQDSVAGGVSEAVVDDVVRRVLERLSDRVVRETVGQILRETAERIVREEIERVRARVPGT
jgi:CheY-like chemotaxis protein